jgi:signal transduction histidine kinase
MTRERLSRRRALVAAKPRPPVPLWAAYLAFSAIVMIGYLAVPTPWHQIAYPAFTFVAAGMFAVGIVIQRPDRPVAFWLFACGIAATGLGDLIYAAHDDVPPYPSLADLSYFAAYGLWFVGLVILVRGRRLRRDLAGWIDTGIAIIALGLVQFVILIHPYFSSPDTPLFSRFASASYPVADVLIVGVLVRLLVSKGSRTMSFRFLVGGFTLATVSDSIYGVIALRGTYSGGLIDLGWLAAYALFAAAALHPSVKRLARPDRDVHRPLSRRRFFTLGTLAIVAPALALIGGAGEHPVVIDLAIAVGASLIFLLVMARMAGLMRRLDESIAEVKQGQEIRGQLLRHTLAASEEERQRIATELHDGAVQHLTALAYRLEGVRNRAGRASPELGSELGTIQKDLAAQVNALRRTMSDLRPGSLVERGVVATLRDHVREVVGSTGVQCNVHTDLPTRPPADVETTLYRVAQEAVGNALTHGAPRRLDVSLDTAEGCVRLLVADDGMGFDPDSPHVIHRSLGLTAMRERIEMAGGTLEIRSRLGGGTTVEARIPLGAR